MPVHVLGSNPPVVYVGLNVAEVVAARGRGRPLGQGVSALIDTGASRTAIARWAVEQLGVDQAGEDEVLRSDGETELRPTFAIRVAFEPNFADPLWPRKVRFFAVIAIEGEPATPGVDVLIGQDILSQVVLAHDGPARRLLLMY